MTQTQDFTPGGVRLEGAWENDRNAASRQLIVDILKECYGQDVQTIIAHHICYQIQYGDMFIVEEIPAMDTMIFDHTIAKHLWGPVWLLYLKAFAQEPRETRDMLFASMYRARPAKNPTTLYKRQGTADQVVKV